MTHTLEPDLLLDRERYKIIKKLGAGDFGAVYEAEDTKENRHVAIKQLPMQMIVDCERQADIRALLVHPAVPRIFGYFSTETHSYLVHELVEGDNLEIILSKREDMFDQATLVDWGIQICDVLNYLHTHPQYPMIFRDLKPNNAMLNAEGKIVLVDFGLARIYPPHYFEKNLRKYTHMSKGLAMGTKGYSPPEQYEGFVRPQSDLYALGATLHHLATKIDPRKEAAFSFDKQKRMCLVNPNLSPAFETVVMKSLKYDFSERFGTALEMKSALGEA